jgi:hypothetical protein
MIGAVLVLEDEDLLSNKTSSLEEMTDKTVVSKNVKSRFLREQKSPYYRAF